MTRSRHPNKEVEDAVQRAEAKGWIWRKQGHWGRMYCPHADRDGCQVGVNGTPKSAEDHARQICRAVDRCSHVKPEAGKEADDEKV